MFRFFLSRCAARGNVHPPVPDGRHDTQFFADFLQRGILRESLKSVNHRLLIGHRFDSTGFPGPSARGTSRVR